MRACQGSTSAALLPASEHPPTAPMSSDDASTTTRPRRFRTISPPPPPQRGCQQRHPRCVEEKYASLVRATVEREIARNLSPRVVGAIVVPSNAQLCRAAKAPKRIRPRTRGRAVQVTRLTVSSTPLSHPAELNAAVAARAVVCERRVIRPHRPVRTSVTPPDDVSRVRTLVRLKHDLAVGERDSPVTRHQRSHVAIGIGLRWHCQREDQHNRTCSARKRDSQLSDHLNPPRQHKHPFGRKKATKGELGNFDKLDEIWINSRRGAWVSHQPRDHASSSASL